jgi:hypothetical protein
VTSRDRHGTAMSTKFWGQGWPEDIVSYGVAMRCKHSKHENLRTQESKKNIKLQIHQPQRLKNWNKYFNVQVCTFWRNFIISGNLKIIKSSFKFRDKWETLKDGKMWASKMFF